MCFALHHRPIAVVILVSVGLASCGKGRVRHAATPPSPQLAAGLGADERIPIDASSFDDALLDLRLRLALLEDVGVSALGVELEAQSGEVRLRGLVPSQLQLQRIAEIAEATPGVRRVDCRLDVAADPVAAIGPLKEAQRRLADAILAARARAALVRELGRSAFDLVVEAAGSQLTVRGSLTDRGAMERALSALDDLEGVEQIDDQLDLGS